MEKDIILVHNPPSDQSVLLFHGLTGAPGEMYHLAKSIFDSGQDVFCPVLPGHCGGTEAIKQARWQDWHEFALKEFDRISKDYSSVCTGGMCLGAVLALDVAAERKSVRSVCCLSTTLFLNGWSIPWFSFLLPLVLYSVMKYFYAFPEGGAFGVKNKDTREKVKNSLSKNDVYLDCFPIISVLEMLRLSRVVRKKLRRVETPVLLLHSARDDLTSTKSAEVVYRKISSKVKEYIVLKNSYHMITLDNEKDFVFSKTVEFFNRSHS